MKELPLVGEIIKEHFPITTKARKRWASAPKYKHYNQLSMQNEALEIEYHKVIAIAKSHLKPGEIYFERDYKQDRRDGMFSMHSFMTPTFYWRLDCSLAYEYIITLVFNNCPYEEEIRKKMRAYPLDRGIQEKDLQSQFDAFYQNVLRVQEQCFLHSLKGT